MRSMTQSVSGSAICPITPASCQGSLIRTTVMTTKRVQ
jgi:hypothetical protein